MLSNDCENEGASTKSEPGEMLRQLLDKESIGRLRHDQFRYLIERTLCPSREGPPDYVQVIKNYRVIPGLRTNDLAEFQIEYEWLGTLLPLTEEDRTEIKWDDHTGTYSRPIRFYRTSQGWKVESSYFRDGEFLPPSVVLTQYGSRLPKEVKKRLEQNL